MFLFKRTEFFRCHSGADGDEDSAAGAQTEHGIAIAKFAARISVCHEGSANPLCVVAAEFVESSGSAVFGFHADFCKRHPARWSAWLGALDERGGSRSSARCAAVCGAHDLQGPCEMDRGNVHRLRVWTDRVFAIARFLVVRRGFVRSGICGNIADGCNQHDRAKSRAG